MGDLNFVCLTQPRDLAQAQFCQPPRGNVNTSLLRNLTYFFSRASPYTGGYQQCERQLVASLESPLIYNELHERIAFAINHLFQLLGSEPSSR